MEKEVSKYLYIHIDGSKCRNVDNMLVEFYDKLNMSYPKFRNLDGLDDWLRDLSWIKNEYPEVKRIFITIHNKDEFLISVPETRDALLQDFTSKSYWGDQQKEFGFDVIIGMLSGSEIPEYEKDERAAWLYARGVTNRLSEGKNALPRNNFLEIKDSWIFAYGPGTDEMRKKDEKVGRVAYIGVPKCFMIEKNTFTCSPISFKKYLQLKKENAR